MLLLPRRPPRCRIIWSHLMPVSTFESRPSIEKLRRATTQYPALHCRHSPGHDHCCGQVNWQIANSRDGGRPPQSLALVGLACSPVGMDRRQDESSHDHRLRLALASVHGSILLLWPSKTRQGRQRQCHLIISHGQRVRALLETSQVLGTTCTLPLASTTTTAACNNFGTSLLPPGMTVASPSSSHKSHSCSFN